MEPLAITLCLLLLSLMIMMCGSLIRKKLINGLKDSIIVTLILGVMYSLIAHLALNVEVKNTIANWQDLVEKYFTRTQFISLGIVLIVICPMIVRVVGKLMVSKPGSQGSSIDTHLGNSSGIEVNLINTLSSLSSAIQNVFPELIQHKDKHIMVSQLEKKVDLLYAEMQSMREMTLTMMNALNYSNNFNMISDTKPKSTEELLDVSNVNLDSEDEISLGYDKSDIEDEIPTVATLHIKKHKKHRSTSYDESRNNREKDSDNRPAAHRQITKSPQRNLDEPVLDISLFKDMTEKDVLSELKKRDAFRRDQQRAPEYLTSDEKKLAMTDLTQLWIEWKSKNPKAFIKEWDHRPLGVLSDEHASLPRRYVRQIIANRRTEAMLAAAKKEGKEVGKCEICSRIYLKERGHRCFITGWGTKMPSATLPSNKNIIVSQDGKHDIKICRRQMVDPDKINKEYLKLTQYHLMKETKDKLKEKMDAENQIENTNDTPAEVIPSESIPVVESTVQNVIDVPESANVITIDKSELYSIMKNVVLEVCDSHFRDTSLAKKSR